LERSNKKVKMDRRQVQYERMTPQQICDARERAPIVYVPAGPLEWHAEHLPIGTDPLHAHHVAVEAARRSGGVVLPALYMGTDSLRPPGNELEGLGPFDLPDDSYVIGMDLPGFQVKSMYFHETVFGLVVRETVRMLKREPWQVIVLVNGHGAPNQARMLQRLASEEREPPRLEVIAETAWDPEAADPDAGPGHADRYETSVLLAVDESLVHVDRLPAAPEPLRYKDHGIMDGPSFEGDPGDGFAVRKYADPRDASREEGETYLNGEIERLAGVATQALSRTKAL
jgi:creatinine amidohydrolase